jgi:hypothetical protein
MTSPIRPALDSSDLGEPVVAALAIADLALDTLVAALFAQHPRLEYDSFLRTDTADMELRHAQLAVSLTRALQRIIHDYAALTAERLERIRDDDILF